MKKLAITLAVVIVGSMLATYYALNYFRTTTEITVNYRNADSVEIYKRTDGESRKVTDVTESGQVIRINSHGTNYFVRYQADEGYADGQQSIDTSKSSIDIEPLFSTERLSSIYSQEKSAIMNQLAREYPDLDELYDLKNDRLYRYGEWFGANLIYKSDGRFNRDNVALVMQKEADNWQVVTDPPMPSLNVYQNPSIPVDVIESLNNQLHN